MKLPNLRPSTLISLGVVLISLPGLLVNVFLVIPTVIGVVLILWAHDKATATSFDDGFARGQKHAETMAVLAATREQTDALLAQAKRFNS